MLPLIHMICLLKIFVFTLSFLAASLLDPPQSWASYLDLQGQDPSQVFKQALESDSMNYSQFSLSSMDQMIMGLTKKLVGYPSLTGETTDTSLLNSTSKAMAFLYTNRPSSLTNYIAYESQRLNLVKPAYAAQGQGWQFLGETTLYIWTKSRNIAYLFFIVIFVVTGFMIMFRSKLNPQTVINIQLALPKIVISLIMVTFSYALSGLIVDVVYFGHDLIRGIITTEKAQGNLTSQCPQGKGHFLFQDQGNPNTQSQVMWEQDCSKGQYTPSVWPFDILAKYASGTDPSGVSNVKNFIGNLFELLPKAIAGGFGGDFGPLFQLIISLSVVGAVFKIFFSLLTKYVMIVILVITMPFSFLGSALSSQSNPIHPLKALLANTISFPITSLLLAIAYYFGSPDVRSTGDLPPFYLSGWTGQGVDPTIPQGITASLIAIGILMAIPTILAAIDKMFESQPIAQAATEQIAGGFRKIPIIGGMMG